MPQTPYELLGGASGVRALAPLVRDRLRAALFRTADHVHHRDTG